VIPAESDAGKEKKDHGDNKQPIDVPLAQQGHHTNDTVGAVILPVPEVKDQTAGVYQEETARDIPVKRSVPQRAGDDDGEHGGDIDPDEGKEEGFANGDMAERAEDALGEFGRRIEKGQQGGKTNGQCKFCQIEEINDGADRADQVKDNMYRLVVVCPLDAAGGAGGARGEIPMKVIAAHGGKEGEPQQMNGRGSTQQQAACLPDTQYGANRNVEAAEDNKIDNFSQHDVFRFGAGTSVLLGARTLLLVKDDDLGGVDGIADHGAVGGALDIELKEKGIVLGGGLVEIAIPGEGEIDLAVVARKGGQLKADGVAARRIGRRQLVDPVSDGPEVGVADVAAACEFEGDPHRVVDLDGSVDGFQLNRGLTGIVLTAANHDQCCYDQCHQ
jgi:hypothetical protein